MEERESIFLIKKSGWLGLLTLMVLNLHTLPNPPIPSFLNNNKYKAGTKMQLPFWQFTLETSIFPSFTFFPTITTQRFSDMEMEMEKGVKRWLVNISHWDPSPHDFSIAMSFLPQQDHSSITRFVRVEDRKRALVSRLLQHALVHQVLGIPFDEIIINRTAEGKPYLESHKRNLKFPNFNFNVSHHGDYVAIASEPICLVGLDIVSCFMPGNETISEFIHNFSSYFSSSEWERIINAGSDDDVLDEFFRYWCLKEAFVKALGSGIGYKLDYVEFHHNDWTNIYVKVDGDVLKDWNFWLFELEGKHRVAVARGHPRIATKSYKDTLNLAHFDNNLYKLGFHLSSPRFVTTTVEELCSLFPRTEFFAHIHP